MSKITASVKDIFNALEKNGFEHLRGTWFRWGDDLDKAGQLGSLVIGGCILGQAAINLGVFQGEDEDQYDEGTLYHALSEFAPILGKWEIPKEDATIFIMSRGSVNVADQLIYWNDKIVDKTISDSPYFLQTWEEVVDMARDCLTPYFDQVVTMDSYDWPVTPYTALIAPMSV